MRSYSGSGMVLLISKLVASILGMRGRKMPQACHMTAAYVISRTDIRIRTLLYIVDLQEKKHRNSDCL